MKTPNPINEASEWQKINNRKIILLRPIHTNDYIAWMTELKMNNSMTQATIVHVKIIKLCNDWLYFSNGLFYFFFGGEGLIDIME